MSHPHHPHKPGDKAGHRKLDDGAEDRLVPLKSIDPLEIRTFDEMLKAMSETAFSGRSLGEAADVLTAMTRDPDCLVVATFSGAMTVAKMGKVIVRMIEAGMIDCIVSTGALMAHGLSEAVGLTHYKVDPTVPDEVLFEKGYNRVYDTLELETNLNDIEVFVRKVLDTMPTDQPWSSESICRALGKALAEGGDSPGILRSAYLRDVPVYVPAFTDSELGLDVATWMMRKRMKELGSNPTPEQLFAGTPPPYNPFLDLLSYARSHLDQEEARHLHHRRRRAAQLGAAGRAVLRHRRAPARRRAARRALLVRRTHLPRARALGRAQRVHVLRGRELGEVRPCERGRPLRRGVFGRDGRLADARARRPRAARQGLTG
jgi:hypothetical protein